MKNNLIGQVGLCSRGRLGLILGRKKLDWGWTWVGIGLDDGTLWASRGPEIQPYSVVLAFMEEKVTEAQ